MGKNTKLGSALAIAVIAATCLAASTANATVYYLTTGQTGPNVTVDAMHNDSWLLNEPVDFSFGGGDFTIKSPGPTADITLTLYLGNSSAGTSLDSVTVVGAP